MSKEIQLFVNKIQNRELLTDPDNLNSILTEIADLRNLVFDLSTMDGVEEARKLKPKATKFIKELKDFCEPLEAEGKKISDARSKITTALLTGRESVINDILEPITIIEKKLKDLLLQIATPIKDLHSCDMRAEELEELEAYEWLAYKKQAATLMGQQKDLITITRTRIEDEAIAEQKRQDFARLEREAEIAKNAAEQATRAAEDKFKREEEEKKKTIIGARIDEDKLREERMGENLKNNVDNAEILKADEIIEHKRKIHNEILGEVSQFLVENAHKNFDQQNKDLVIAIAKGEIPHLYIKY